MARLPSSHTGRVVSLRILVVGAGLYGSVCAQELGRAGHECHVIERRDHIAGNIFTRYVAEADCHQHVYGAHIFHTSNQTIWDYVNRFASFNHYVNRVKVRCDDRIFSFPINLFTIHQLFGSVDPQQAREAIEADRVPYERPANMEEFCLTTIGRKLYAQFIEGYTTKQWGRHPRDLPADIVKRLPVRYNFDDNYFSDRFQGIPTGGYTALVEAMLEGSTVELGVDFFARRADYLDRYDLIIFSGAIDEFFDFADGVLAYRSLRFEHELLPVADYQGNAVVNYTSASVPYTRILEHKHFDMRYSTDKTLITREYPDDWELGKTRYYPINDVPNTALYQRYRARAETLAGKVKFGGRLGAYQYYDMHQVVGAALKYCAGLLGKDE